MLTKEKSRCSGGAVRRRANSEGERGWVGGDARLGESIFHTERRTIASRTEGGEQDTGKKNTGEE